MRRRLSSSTASRCSSRTGPLNQGVRALRARDVVAGARRDRDGGDVVEGELRRQRLRKSASIARKVASSKSTRSILLTASTTLRMPSSDTMTACRRVCVSSALGGVDQQDGEVGGRGAGRHVARVLDVARRVGDDEAALRRGEEAVGDVDGDALLALRLEPVDEQREVDVRRRPCRASCESRSRSATWSSIRRCES